MALIEDAAMIRSRMMKKEKAIKDIMRSDCRMGFQFISALRRDFDKDPNVLTIKFSLLAKLEQVFQPGGSTAGPDDFLRIAGFLQDIIQRQMEKVDVVLSSNTPRSLVYSFQNASGEFDIKDAIKEYMVAKEMVKKNVREFILKHRSGIIKSRSEADVAYMKKSGQLSKTAGPTEVESVRKDKEESILQEIVLAEMSKKTERMEDGVNRIVQWRARIASYPPGSVDPRQIETEKRTLLMDFLQAVDEIKSKAVAESGGGGITASGDAMGKLAGLKPNLSEQRSRCGHVIEFLNFFHRPENAGKVVHEVEGSAVSQTACDHIEELMKLERDVYVDLRHWETDPGRFFQDMSTAVHFDEQTGSDHPSRPPSG